MKRFTLTILTVLLMAGCSDDDSGRQATTTSASDTTESRQSNNRRDRSYCEDRGYTCDTNSGNTSVPTNSNGQYGSGYTPASYGESSFGGITISYNASSSSSVVAEGILDLDQDYGFLDCQISKGSYNISTRTQGLAGDIVHHYKNIQVNIGSNITGLLENVVALENQNGQWVQDVRLKINRVNGNDCSYLSLYFAMPFAD